MNSAVKQILKLLLFAGILAWLGYGFCAIRKQINTSFVHIDWYYAILAYAGLGIAALLLVDIVTTARKLNKTIRIKSWLIVLSTVLTFCALEVLFRATNFMATYTESRSNLYLSYFLSLEKGRFHIHQPGQVFNMQGPEFSYPRKANSMGLDDYEPTEQKDTGEIRLITLGDSFTEGDGAPFDSSYPMQLKQMLAQQFPQRKFSLINAGIFGSDPYFDYVLLKERLLKYKPDVVLITLSTGDLFDIYYRGNMNRFKPGGKIKYKDPPWWEPVYAVSRVSRLFFKLLGYNLSMIFKYTRNTEFEKEKNDLKELCRQHNSLAIKYNYRVVVLIRPDKDEVIKRSYFNNFEDMNNCSAGLGRVLTVDLLNYYLLQGITPENIKQYYWQLDGHHTSLGYSYMAKGALGTTALLVGDIEQ
jgi:hypothetical protein